MENKKRFEQAVLFFVVSALLFFAVSTRISSADDSKKPVGSSSAEPVVITSSTLSADNKARVAVFEGSVVAKKGEMTMFSDRMTVYYSDEQSGSSITKIDSEGHVKVIKGDRVITSRAALYLAEPDERIIFTGEPRASEGQNVVTGTKMTYFIKDDRSIVENSKVFIVNKGSSKTGLNR
ncbi:MAG: LptA/OstA family protein [Dissulfurispiraceae bacterium]|jgi:lipopolysaccharide export system protein LptA|nr:LptA/OstA family protein [Dissulfurispiraceae bacterium]